MGRLSANLKNLRDLWQLGALALLLLLVAALAGVLVALVPSLLLGALIEAATGLDAPGERWVLIFSPLWLPVFVGLAARGLPRLRALSVARPSL